MEMENWKAFDEIKELCEKYSDFKSLVLENLKNGRIRYFNNEEWDRINSQNYIPPIKNVKGLADMFRLGYNIGDCQGMSYQLSYSYNDVDIVSGILPILKGTRNAEQEGGHCWLETSDYIIDTTLMLVIDKSLKRDFGYIEESRLTQQQLNSSPRYLARKEFVNDRSIRRSS